MSRSIRTLIFRIHSGRAPYLARMLKKPLHHLSLAKFDIRELVSKYSLRESTFDIFYGPGGSYLHLHLVSKTPDDGDNLANNILTQSSLFGRWLGIYSKFPVAPGALIYELKTYKPGHSYRFLWSIDEPVDLDIAAHPFFTEFDHSGLGELAGVSVAGSLAHYHQLNQQYFLGLELRLESELPWSDVCKALILDTQNPSFVWLNQHGLLLNSSPTRSFTKTYNMVE